jgi:hypothetical protein
MDQAYWSIGKAVRAKAAHNSVVALANGIVVSWLGKFWGKNGPQGC